MNLLEYVTNHQCIQDCNIACLERENCFVLDWAWRGINAKHIYHAQYIRDMGVKIGDNSIIDNDLIFLNRKNVMDAIRILCDANYLSASVSHHTITILDSDTHIGFYETVLYDCCIDDDNNVIFDGGRVVPCSSNESAIEYALTSTER